MRSKRVKRIKRSKKSKMSKRLQKNKRTRRVNKKKSRRKQINSKRTRKMRGGAGDSILLMDSEQVIKGLKSGSKPHKPPIFRVEKKRDNLKSFETRWAVLIGNNLFFYKEDPRTSGNWGSFSPTSLKSINAGQFSSVEDNQNTGLLHVKIEGDRIKGKKDIILVMQDTDFITLLKLLERRQVTAERAATAEKKAAAAEKAAAEKAAAAAKKAEEDAVKDRKGEMKKVDWRAGETSSTAGIRRLANIYLVHAGFESEKLCDLYNLFHSWLRSNGGEFAKTYNYHGEEEIKEKFPTFQKLFISKYGEMDLAKGFYESWEILKNWFNVQLELLHMPVYKERIEYLKKRVQEILAMTPGLEELIGEISDTSESAIVQKILATTPGLEELIGEISETFELPGDVITKTPIKILGIID